MTDMDHLHVRSEEILISIADSTDIDHILKFYEKNLGSWKQFIKFWDWRQNQNPYQREPKAVTAKEGGKIVGCMSVNAVLLAVGDRRISASWQQDSLVLRSMQGKGIGRKLIREANKNFEMNLAKGTSKSMYALRKSSGYQDVPNTNCLVRIEKPRPLKGRTQEGIAEHLIAQWRLFMPRLRINKDIYVHEINSFDASFDNLAVLLAKEKIRRIFKDRKYLAWRYFQCPGKSYTIFRAGGKEARGAIVINTTGDGEGWIVDLISLSSDRQCIDALLAKAVNHFKTNRIARIWVFATLGSTRKRLYRFGFLPTPNNPRFTYAWNGDSSGALGVKLWDFWHGDGDIELYM